MNKQYFTLNYKELSEVFYLDGNQLYKHGASEPVSSKAVHFNGIRPTVRRVIFTLLYEREPVTDLLLDDDGYPVEVSNRVFMMFAYKNSDKNIETSESKKGLNGYTNQYKKLYGEKSYMARYTPIEGDRTIEVFDTIDEAKTWFVDNMKRVWGEEFKRLNLYNTYFG